MLAYREAEILHLAVKALRAESGVELESTTTGDAHDPVDFVLKPRGIPDVEYAAEVKAWAGHANFGALVARLNSLGKRPLLVADYINPKMAGRLRDHGIEFIDTVGNAYLHVAGRLFVFTKGNKVSVLREAQELRDAVPVRIPNAMGRALEPSGLRVVFAFLCEPSLVEKPYRDIAEVADVAVGTVGWVIRGLKEGGYLVDRGNIVERRLVRREQLLQRWVESYPLKLRPKLHLGDFFAPAPGWWKQSHHKKYECHWGGEVAAAKLTGNLQPEVASVYLPESNLKTFVVGNRLRKYDEAAGDGMKVQIYARFWNAAALASAFPARDVAPPLLVYADLVASGDPRNLENARAIYERWFVGPDWKD